MPDKIDKIIKLNEALPLPKKGLYKLKSGSDITDYDLVVQSKSEGKTYLADSSFVAPDGVESVVAGSGVTVDDTDPANPIVSANIYLEVTYAELTTLISGSDLIPGAKYFITDFATIYDQSISDVTKTAAGEDIVVTATSIDTLSPIAESIDFPQDVIHYDASVVATFVNAAACKGKITYRRDEKGNSAPFDFRKVLMYNSNDLSEALFFDLTEINTANDVASTEEFMNQFGLEFPASFITGDSIQNSNNLFGNSYIDGDLKQSSNNQFFGSKFKNITQATGNLFSEGNDFQGDIVQMVNMDVTNCTIIGTTDYCTSSTWANTTFGENVNKSISSNFNWATVGGRIDRLINCAVLGAEGTPTTIGGRLFWCQNLFLDDVQVVGYIEGLNSLSLDNTTANCNLEQINGVTMYDLKFGFQDCTITGTTAGDSLGNITVNCMVLNKTIDQATYPELFNLAFHKTVYAKPNGTFWYTWLDNSNVAQFTEIT